MRDTDVAAVLRDSLEQVEAPGAVLALRHDGETTVHAAGIANRATGQEMTPDTCLPIASISKVFTATLAMQLVDEGVLDLDTPIRTYLPDFCVADRDVTSSVTARQLLTHTAGVDGDKEDAFGRGNDAVARFVADCAALGQIHPPGATYSYCNSGMIILGHLVAQLRGTTWDEAIRSHLFEPLQMRHAGTLAEDVINQRFAAGHPPGADKGSGRWELERSHGPAGGVMCTAGDLLRFGQAHLDDGALRSGHGRLLSVGSARAMRAPQLALPNPYEGETHWGLGWGITRIPGQSDLIGHTGDLLGYHTRLLLCSDPEFGFALLANGDGAEEIADRLLPDLLAEIGHTWPMAPRPPARLPDVDLDQVQGTYQTLAVRVDVTRHGQGDRLHAAFEIIAPRVVALLEAEQRTYHETLVPVDGRVFLRRDDDDEDAGEVAVFSRSGGHTYLHMGGRAFRRRDAGADTRTLGTGH